MLSPADRTDIALPIPPAFGITQRELDARTCVIAVEGELDLSTAPRLKWMLVEALQAGQTQLIVDLSATSFMDSTALGVLIGVNRGLDVGARLAIVCPRSKVLKIFELSGMDGAFSVFDTLDQAVTHAQGHTGQDG
jgi:anti-sigma B factor antagonist